MQLEKLNLRNNNLDGENILRDHQEVFKMITEVDLSENDLGKGIGWIRSCIEDSKSR